MTTTFIDPPGRLPGSFEPLDFTTDRAVTSISIEFNPEFGNGFRETVWDGTSDEDDSGGDFSWSYRQSTVSDLDGAGPHQWHIVRTGGWPAGFRVRVKEIRVESGGGGEPTRFAALTPTAYGPVAQWALQGSPDTGRLWLDRSGNSYHLTRGLPDYASDLIPGQTCVTYTASAGGVDNATRLQRRTITPALQITGALTVTARVKVSSSQGGPIIVQSGIFGQGAPSNTLFTLSVNPDRRLAIFYESSPGGGGNVDKVSTNPMVPLDQWCFVSFRRSDVDGRWTFGVNSTFDVSTSGTLPSGGTNTYTSVGTIDEDADTRFTGLLADVSVWNTRLTDDQLLPLYKTVMGID